MGRVLVVVEAGSSTLMVATMDLLGSILGSMDKPPSASEKERKLAKGKLQYLLKFIKNSNYSTRRSIIVHGISTA